MDDREHPSLSVVRQCKLLYISRSGLYYQPKGISEEDLTLMKLIDRQYLATPFYGAHHSLVSTSPGHGILFQLPHKER